jgi:hypothetical protein
VAKNVSNKIRQAAALKPFRFSEKASTQLKSLFEGKGHATGFISDAQHIVAKHVLVVNDYAALPAARMLQANARAIQKTARTLVAEIRRLTDTEKELLGQHMWLVDKRAYFPSASSVTRVVETLSVVVSAAQELSQAGRNGRPSIQVDGLIREVHASYVTRFGKKVQTSVVKDRDFAAAVRICVAEAGAPVAGLSQTIKAALGD